MSNSRHFSIYLRTRSLSAHENNNLVHGWNPTSPPLKLNTMVHDRLDSYTKVQIYHALLLLKQRHFSIYIPTIALSVNENDYPTQGWNPTSIHLPKLNIMMHVIIEPCTTVQNSALICYQNSHGLGTVVYYQILTEVRKFKTIVFSCSIQLTNPNYHSIFTCTACLKFNGLMS